MKLVKKAKFSTNDTASLAVLHFLCLHTFLHTRVWIMTNCIYVTWVKRESLRNLTPSLQDRRYFLRFFSGGERGGESRVPPITRDSHFELASRLSPLAWKTQRNNTCPAGYWTPFLPIGSYSITEAKCSLKIIGTALEVIEHHSRYGSEKSNDQQRDPIRAVFNWVSKVTAFLLGFCVTTVRSVIGW